MTEEEQSNSHQLRRVLPDELTEGFSRLGLREGNNVAMHASLLSIGVVEGGAAMVLHRLLNVLGKKGTLLMPTFTSVTRHGSTHENFTQMGCWCEGRENRHLPFISELQPDKELGEIAYRLCSWPSSRRSRHPAFSFVAVGQHTDELVGHHSLTDLLQPLKTLLKEDPYVLTIGVGLDFVSAIHVAVEHHVPSKFVKERALSMASKGPTWVEVVAPGCSAGFQKLAKHIRSEDIQRTEIGSTRAFLYPMKQLIAAADRLLEEDPTALNCERPDCLSCRTSQEN
jgi:aminoglycoside 3-N-acetyltransferase